MSLLWARVAAWVDDYAHENDHPATMPVEKAGYAGWTTAEYMAEPGDKPHHFNEELMEHLLGHDGRELQRMSEPRRVGIREPVYATQSHITEDGVRKYLNGGSHHNPANKPRFVRHQGNLYVDDGHHRVGAALLRGDDAVDGYYYDADKHGFPEE